MGETAGDGIGITDVRPPAPEHEPGDAHRFNDDLLMQGKLEMGHARALLAVSPARQAELAHQIISRNLSVREAEQLVHQADAAPRKSVRKQPRKDRDLQALEEDLAEIVGATVSIQASRGGKGKLVINYGSLDQLDGIVARLRGARGD